MAMPTITLATAKASTEAKAAIGKIVNKDDEARPGKPATEAQVDVWLVRQLRGQVLKDDLAPLNAADEATRRAELKTVGW